MLQLCFNPLALQRLIVFPEACLQPPRGLRRQLLPWLLLPVARQEALLAVEDADHIFHHGVLQRATRREAAAAQQQFERDLCMQVDAV